MGCNSPLYCVIACSKLSSHGYFEIVELLLHKGASVSVRGDNGRTVLAVAKGPGVNAEGHIKAINLLRSYGAHK
jgi:ankyrin repeat protein